MVEVVGHVVAAEGEHGHRVEAQFADLAACCCGGLARHDRAEEHAVVPVEGLGHEGDGGAATTAEEDRGDGNALGVLPLGGDARTLGGRCGEAGVRVCGGGFALWGPGVVAPVGGAGWLVVRHALPPHVAVLGEGGVGEDAVRSQRVHRIGVGVVTGAGGDAEEACFGVDGIELAVVAELHPADVVSDGLGFPAWDGGNEHGEVGLATG